MKNLLPKSYYLQFLLFLFITGQYALGQQINTTPWYSFSSDYKECIIKNSNLPTPWLNRLGNEIFFTWITHNGYVESFLLDPATNGLTNPQNTSGRFYVRDKSDGSFFQINIPVEAHGGAPSPGAASQGGASWECRVGLGYNKISNKVKGLATQATYFIPREDNLLVVIVEIANNSGLDKNLDVFGQLEFNLGDPTKSIIYRGDGRGGSQYNLYKKVFMRDNAILAIQENWRSTANCIPWPYTGFFSVSERIASYETIKDNFLGIGRDYDHPLAVENGKCTNTDFWSQDQYPWGVLQNTISLKPGESKTLIYTLGMLRNENEIQPTVNKYNDLTFTKQSLNNLSAFYDHLINSGVIVQTPDKENDRMINIWTKYLWRQFWKKSLNNGAYGLGAWSYGLEGEGLGVTPEQFLMPFDMDILNNAIGNLLRRQVSDTTQTDVFGPGEHSLLYKDIGLTGPPKSHKGQFAVPHHHSIYELFSIYFYLLESGDLKMLDTKVPYLEGNEGTVWEHIQIGLAISVKGIDSRGLPKIPARVGDWNDEFTKVSEHGDAESQMLAAEMCLLLKGFAEIARQTHHDADYIKWMSIYNRMKDAVNKLAWNGEWYIAGFSDKENPFIPVGNKDNKEGKIYLNSQSWPILSGIASPQQATQSMLAVKKYLMSDYGPMVFAPSYTQYNNHIGTQSIYAPGFRNACIYLRPVGWAICSACLNNQPELANEMYNAASLKSREKDMENYHCEPYVYPENFIGPDHRLKGEGQFQWNLGEGSAWMWTSYVDYILGVRPVLSGLLIDPKIPSDWQGFSVERDFRGDHYSIQVTNPKKVSQGVKSITVDGKKIKGNIIIPVKDGKNHLVKVLMGAK